MNVLLAENAEGMRNLVITMLYIGRIMGWMGGKRVRSRRSAELGGCRANEQARSGTRRWKKIKQGHPHEESGYLY